MYHVAVIYVIDFPANSIALLQNFDVVKSEILQYGTYEIYSTYPCGGSYWSLFLTCADFVLNTFNWLVVLRIYVALAAFQP